MRELKCLRCGEAMEFGMTERFQLGQTGLLLGDIPNIVAGSLELDVYFCPSCGKVEFYTPKSIRKENGRYSNSDLPQRECPRCGSRHDFDYPKCPDCGYDYYAR